MTVEELMEELAKRPADALVVLCVDGEESENFTVDLADTGDVMLDGKL